MTTAVRLADVCEVNPPLSIRPAGSEIVSFLPMSAVETDGTTGSGDDRVYADVVKGYTQFERGDLLVAKITPCFENGKIAQACPRTKVAAGSTEFHVVRVRPDLCDARYMLRYLRQPCIRAAGEQRMTGSGGQRRVPEAFLRELKLPLPPIEEQRRIAAVLDQADAVRAKRRESVALLDSLADSVFLDMFADTTHPILPLDDLIDPARPICYGILKPGADIAGGRPYVRVVDMKNGTVAHAGVRRTTAEIDHQYRRSRLMAGDLLMSIRGHVGRLALVPNELDGANITQDSARIGIVGAEPAYVLAHLRSEGSQRWMARHVRGVAVRGINIRDVRRIPIVLPPIEEQRTFTARVAHVAVASKAAHGSSGHLDELFASLQQRAFAGAL